MKTRINKIAFLLFISFFSVSVSAQYSSRLYEVYESSLRGFVGWRTTDGTGGLHIGSANSNSKMIFSIGASKDSDQSNEFMRLYREGVRGVLQLGNPNQSVVYDTFMGVHDLAFRPNKGVPTLYLTQGKVGIGNDTPTYTLDVRGNAQISTGNDNFRVTQRSDGNLQIGNSVPRDWYLASNGTAVVKITSGGSVVFLSNKSATWPTISTANLDKYDIFAARGVLAADFAVGPTSSWADYVLAEDYTLPSLSEVETYIKENGKLPGIPSAGEVAEEGYSLHDMNVKLLEKVEQLTLYIIGQNKEINELKEKLDSK